MKVTFLGLGRMGFFMAERLLKRGIDLTVFNRTKEKASPLLEKGATWAPTPREGAAGCDVIATMLSDDRSLEAVVSGPDGFLESLPAGAIHLSFSTISVSFSDSLAKRHENRGQGFVAAPVFGRPDAVASGNLRLLCAGPDPVTERIRPVLDLLGSRVFMLGENPATANLVKLSGNFMIASTLETLAEGFTLMQKSGVDPALFLEIVNDSLFRSPLYANYGTIMAEQQYGRAGFSMDLGLKDVNLILEAANSLRVPLPLAGVVRDSLLSGLARGRQSLDWSALLLSSFDRAGLSE